MANHDKSTATDGEAEKLRLQLSHLTMDRATAGPCDWVEQLHWALSDSGVGAVTAVALGIWEPVLDSEVRPAA